MALVGGAAFILLVWTVPLLWTLLTSFKNDRDVLVYPPLILFEPTLANYREVLLGPTNVVGNLVASVILALVTTALTMVIAVPAAYSFARLKVRGKKPLGFYVLATQFVPPMGLIIPYFLILNQAKGIDTYWGLVLIYLTFSLPFAIWLMISYFEDIPREMEEAALLDRATRLQAFLRVILHRRAAPSPSPSRSSSSTRGTSSFSRW